MTQQLLNLRRELYEVKGSDWADTDADTARVLKKLETWPQVLQNKCSVLVGSANSGKTSELRLQVERLRKEETHACFMAVRELLHFEDLDGALSKADAKALSAWEKSPTERLYVFLDSIDEATLSGPRDLKTCLRKLVNRLRRSLESVTWVLSTRPAVLNQEVIEVIEDALEVALPSALHVGADTSSLNAAGSATAQAQVAAPPAESLAKVFRLAPLSRVQAKTLLKDAYQCPSVDALVAEADRLGLSYHLLTPGRCKLLTRLDLLGNPPNSLGQTYSRSALAHLDAPTNGRKHSAKTSRDDLEAEAFRLACASTLCARLNIELPSEADEPSANALSAHRIVRTLLDSDLQYLLSSDFFEESGRQQVKIQPDDIRFYLAARRLDRLVSGPDEAIKLAQLLGWSAPTGECGIFAPFMPVAGWMSALNQYFRSECLKLDPQCVAFFGDLRSLPPQDAVKALDTALAKLVRGERIGRGAYNLTSENYWQAGAPSVLQALPGLFTRYAQSEDIRELLLEIAGSSRSPVLLAPAFKLVGSSHQKLLDHTDLLEYFLEVETAEHKKKLCAAALKLGKVPERTLAILLRACSWSSLNTQEIAKLVTASPTGEGGSFVLGYTLTHDVASAASADELCELSGELLTRVIVALPLTPDDSVYEALHESKWLAEVVGELLANLASRKLPAKARKNLAQLMVRYQVELLERDYSASIQADELREALREPSEVREAVVRELFRVRKASDVNEAWRILYSGQAIVIPNLEEARSAKALPFVEAIKQHAEAVERGKKQAPRETKHKRTLQPNEKARKDLTKRKSAIRAGTDLNALAWVAQVLSYTSGLSRYGDVELGQFRKVYGDELTSAVEQGLKALWRKEAPRRDEENPRSTYWVTIAALQGLHLEFGDASDPVPANKAELHRALDYGLYELNGVPKWYWRLVATDIKESVKFLRKTLQVAGKGAVSKERAAKVLTLLEESPSEIQRALANLVWSTVCTGKLDQHQTDTVLSLLVQNGLVPRDTFNAQARKVLLDDPRGELAAIWSVNWMSVDSAAFMAAVRAVRKTDARATDALLAAVGTALDDGRGPNLLELSKNSSAAVASLKQLYLELMRVVPRDEDPVREPFKAYSVDARERARRTRDRIPGLLAATHSSAGYLALQELRGIAKSEPERSYYAHLMHQMAEAMARPARAMSEVEYLEFEQTLQARPGSLDTFAQRVEYDILDVKETIEHGDFSPRRFLATNFQDLEAGAIRAMEDDFQLFLAGQLDVVGRTQYSVFREPQDSEDARRDITVAAAGHDWKVTLELKVTEGGWTAEDYRDSLRNQLVGQYMKKRNTTVGFFVVLLQRARTWMSPQGELGFDGLLDLLRADALLIEAERPGIRLRVIGIDATEPVKVDGTLVRAKAAPKAVRQAKRAAKDKRRRQLPTN